jgi:hypothetical protein
MTSAMAENETEYGDITDEIGGTYDSIFGSTLLIGIVIFLFFFIVTLLLGLGMLVGSVVLLPSLFIVFEFIPSLRIIVAIALGLIFGLALNKLIRR